MPVKLRLELMPVVRADFLEPEWELFDDVIDEVDRISLRVLFIDLKDPHTRRVIDCSKLETSYFFALFSYECQELDVHLDAGARHLFLISLCINFTYSGSTRQSVYPWRRSVRETVASDILMS